MTSSQALDALAGHPQITRFRELAVDPDPRIAADWNRKLPDIALEWLTDASIQEQVMSPRSQPQPVRPCGSC